MSFFQSNNFYLTEEECKTINKLRKDIEEKFHEDFEMMHIDYTDLKHNEEMNESYYED
jgi:short-subunit dehydrogenase